MLHVVHGEPTLPSFDLTMKQKIFILQVFDSKIIHQTIIEQCNDVTFKQHHNQTPQYDHI